MKKYSEDAKVAVRNIRRDANDDLKKLEKNGEMTEDELRSSTEDVQKLTDEYVSKIGANALTPSSLASFVVCLTTFMPS